MKKLNLTPTITALEKIKREIDRETNTTTDQHYYDAYEKLLTLDYKVVIDELLRRIDEIEHKCKTRLSSPRALLITLCRVNNYFDLCKSQLVGTKLHIQPTAQKFPNAYKYIPMGTTFHIIGEKRGFILYNITRDNCNKHNTVWAELSEATKESIIHKFSVFYY